MKGFTYRETAAAMGLSPQTVANQLSAALRSLRQGLAVYRDGARETRSSLVLGVATAIGRWAVAAAYLAIAGCGTALSPSDPTDIGAWMDLYQVPGVSVAVIRDFAVAYVEVHGVKSRVTLEPVTEQTLFQAASLSKSVSAMGVMSLVEDGIVSLDRNVNDYLTSWKVPNNEYQATEKVTLRRLLSHTAGTTVPGFRGYRYTEPLPNLIQILNGEYPANSAPIVVDQVPGRALRYSGGGYEIMEQVVLDVTGAAFTEFIWERVLAPIGMVHSTYRQPIPDSLLEATAAGYYSDGSAVPGRHHIYPELAAAALWTTPTDVARFLIEVQRSLHGESNRVLSRATTELLVTEVKDDHSLGFYQRSIRGEPYLWHAGANDGFRGGMAAHLFGGYGVVVLTNSDHGNELTEAIINVIGERERWPGF
jgi:CubicO group peptidase (beta-lactamase class C family)